MRPASAASAVALTHIMKSAPSIRLALYGGLINKKLPLYIQGVMYVCMRRQMYHEIQHGYMGKHFRLRSGLDRGNAMPLE